MGPDLLGEGGTVASGAVFTAERYWSMMMVHDEGRGSLR
jgi:hypothetical protein